MGCFFKIPDKFKEGKTHWFDCKCGRKYKVVTNVYDRTNSGLGSCECGQVTYVN